MLVFFLDFSGIKITSLAQSNAKTGIPVFFLSHLATSVQFTDTVIWKSSLLISLKEFGSWLSFVYIIMQCCDEIWILIGHESTDNSHYHKTNELWEMLLIYLWQTREDRQTMSYIVGLIKWLPKRLRSWAFFARVLLLWLDCFENDI